MCVKITCFYNRGKNVITNLQKSGKERDENKRWKWSKRFRIKYRKGRKRWRKERRYDESPQGALRRSVRDTTIVKARVLHVIYLYGPRAEGKYTYFGDGEGTSLSRNEGGKRLFVVLAAVSTSLTLPV